MTRGRLKKRRVTKDRKLLRDKNGTRQLTEISNSTDRKITKTDADRKREREACCIISFNKRMLYQVVGKMLESYD